MADLFANNDTLRGAGDFIVKAVTLFAFNGAEIDINLLKTSLVIEEDIFKPSISGSITLIDTNDLPNLIPLHGNERMRITFTIPDVTAANSTAHSSVPEIDEDFDMEFQVYRISPKKRLTDRQLEYTIFFCSKDFLINFQRKVYRGYKNTLQCDMVKDIFERYIQSDKPLVIEKTKFNHDLCLGNHSPYEVISWITSRSVSNEGNGCAYVFFEDKDQYNFVTLGKLLTQEPADVITLQPKRIRIGGENGSINQNIFEEDVKSVESYVHTSGFDTLHNLTSGMYSGRLITFDPIRRKFNYEDNDFDLKEEFESFKHLEKNKTFTDDFNLLGAAEAFIKMSLTNIDHDSIEHINSKEPGINPDRVEEYSLTRTSQLMQLMQHKIALKVSGDPRRKAGQIIEFKLPQALGNVSKENPQEPDKYLSGKYLVTSVRHELLKNQYFMYLNIVKDTFVNTIEHVDPNEVLKDAGAKF